MIPSPPPSIARWTLRVAVSILLLLLGAEVLTRWIDPQLPSWQGGDHGSVVLSGHPTRLWAMRPGIKENHQTTATIHELGLRGTQTPGPRSDGQERILVVGDSPYFGYGVGDDQTFHSSLSRLMGEQGVVTDTLNGAVPGYSIAQTLLLMEDVGWDLDPTLLILGNLWSDNNFDAFSDEDLLHSRRFANLNPLAHSALVRWLAGQLSPWFASRGSRLVTWSRHSSWPEARTRRVPVQRYAELLDTVIREAADRGVGVVLLAPCNVESVQGRLESSWLPYFEAQRQVAAHHQVPLVELRDAFAETADQLPRGASALFVDQVHPSIEGHRLLAATLAGALTDADWPREGLIATSKTFDPSDLKDTATQAPDAVEGTHSIQETLFGGREGHFGGPEPTVPPSAPPQAEVAATAQAFTALKEDGQAIIWGRGGFGGTIDGDAAGELAANAVLSFGDPL
ncbi:MAG: SGNH/GDSL hydrolase family protein, partial [Myxococcota bacterium]|nr:SGNH/GDSL hydrolase family protein [Myxococcota bacterium]